MQEEWSFLDGDRDTVRQLDILATKRFEAPSESPSLVRPRPSEFRSLLGYELDLFVECKKSDLPYLFFLREGASNTAIPEVYGLPHEEIVYGTDRENLFIHSPMADVLGAWEAREASPPLAVSVSKAHRKGGGSIELSGDEVFRGLTVPVLKAVDHFRTQVEPPEDWLYRTIRFLVPIVVLDAPMVGVSMTQGVVSLVPLSSVRLTITRPKDDAREYESAEENRIYGVDFVSLESLDEYVTSTQEWAQVLMSRIDEFATQVVTGQALVEIPELFPNGTDDNDESSQPPYVHMRPLLDKEAESEAVSARYDSFRRSQMQD
jgi:hypothetical protein